MTALDEILTFPVLVGEPDHVFDHPARQARLHYTAVIVCEHSFGIEALCEKCNCSADQYTRYRNHTKAGGRTKGIA